MKRLILLLAAVLMAAATSFAQNRLNDKAESILGDYESGRDDDVYRVRVTAVDGGTYKAEVYYVMSVDKHGVKKESHDSFQLIEGLRYNPSQKYWRGKILHPELGIKATATCSFLDDGRLKLKGSVMGVGMSIYWRKIK